VQVLQKQSLQDGPVWCWTNSIWATRAISQLCSHTGKQFTFTVCQYFQLKSHHATVSLLILTRAIEWIFSSVEIIKMPSDKMTIDLFDEHIEDYIFGGKGGDFTYP